MEGKLRSVASSATRATAPGMRAWVAGAVVMLWAGCFHHPNLDVESLPCAGDENCPVGSTCDLQKGLCHKSGAAGRDSGSGDAVSVSGAVDVPFVPDGAADLDAVGAIDVARAEASRVGPGGSDARTNDVAPDGASDGPTDAPDRPPEAGDTGEPDTPLTGTGGAGGSGGIIASGGASGGITGTGGLTGLGGIAGTGGLVVSSGVGGLGGISTGGTVSGGGTGGTPGTGGTGDCHDSTDCSTGRICGASVPNVCGDCSTDQQCRQDTRYGTGHICVGNLCVPGNCHASGDCTTAGQVCNATTHTCGACTSDTQCAAEYTNRPICVTTTGLATTGLCVANTNLCTVNNVTCPSNSSDFCCGGECVPGNCCVTADCTAVDPDYVCQDNICTHCDAVTGRNYFVDPVNGDDARANGSRRAGGAAAAGCAFKTLTRALEIVGTPTAATTITIVGPSTLVKAPMPVGTPFDVPARVTMTTQGGAVTLSLVAGDVGFRFIGGANADSALLPADGAALTIDGVNEYARPGCGIRVESTVTGTITISNVTVNRAGSGATAAVEIAGGTVAMSNVTIGDADPVGVRITGGTTTLSNLTIGTTSTNGANYSGIVVAAGTVTINQGVQVAFAGQDGLAVTGGTVTINNGTATNTVTRFNSNGGAGIRVGATGVLDLTGAISGTSRSVVTQDNTGSNVYFASSSTTASSINGLYSFGSAADGLLIVAGSRIRVRNSTFLGNDGNGINIDTSGIPENDVLGGIDLGTGTGTTGNVRGRNTLQTASPTSSRNGYAGLCIGSLTNAPSPSAQILSAQANLFAGVDCATNNPGDIAMSTTCTGNTDLGIVAQPDGVTVAVETDNCTQP